MIRIALASWILMMAALPLIAQTPQPIQPPTPPQSPRQALLEMFLGTAPDHLERHLPEAARKHFKQLQSRGNLGFLSELSGLGAHAKGAGGFQTMETGPVLLVAEEPGGRQKFEVVVERDDMVGDGDEIDLSFHLYKNGQQQTLPVLPRLTFTLKMESNVWRLYDVVFSARVPLADPDFLKDVVKDLEEQQRRRNDSLATWSVSVIVRAEKRYQAVHPERGFTCSLSQLSTSTKEAEQPGVVIDEELAAGEKNGYVFALTGCDNTHFKVAAEPAVSGGGQRAYCADESGTIKFAKNGKATTCLTAGESLTEGSVVYYQD
jgi:hypothetical protein